MPVTEGIFIHHCEERLREEAIHRRTTVRAAARDQNAQYQWRLP
jgi:hypothetical protein